MIPDSKDRSKVMEDRATRPGSSPRLSPRVPVAPSAEPSPLHPTVRDASAPPSTRKIPRQLDGYEMLEEIGRGGMGIVYKALQIQLDRIVALKMMRAFCREDLLRFRTEAEAVARLQHPNIVQIFEVREQDAPFICMEHCSGGSLDRYLDGKPIAPLEAGRLVEALARAVQHAHEKGILHRDLKPANVLLVEQANPSAPGPRFVPKITDFGLAKRLDLPAGPTRVGEVLGTPAYMAPEQAEGNKNIGPAADLYSLGVILYECLVGRPPFLADTLPQTLDLVRHADPVPPRTLRTETPRDLETICLKCLAKEPGKRYPSAGELADDLARFQRGEAIRARPVGMWERVWKWGKRRPATAALALCSFGMVLLLAAAIPIYICHLQAKVAEISSAMASVRESQRCNALCADCERKLSEGLAALAKGEAAKAQRAIVLADTVTELLSREDSRTEFARLRTEAAALHEQASNKWGELVGLELARGRARRFYERRDEAMLQLHSHLIAGPSPEATQAALGAAKQALAAFPEISDLPAVARERLRTARCEVAFVLAEATARTGDSPARLHSALALLDDAGDGKYVHERRARYLDLLGQKAQASLERTRANAKEPDTAVEWFLVGQERLIAGEARAAVLSLDRALEADPDLFWAQFLKAAAHLELKEHGEASAALTLCLRARPNFVWLHVMRGYVQGQAGRTAAALADFSRAEKLAPSPAARYAIHVNRGVLALSRKNATEAMREFEAATRLMPDRWHAHANLAEALHRCSQPDRALETLEQAIQLAPGQLPLLRTRARLLRERGDTAAALADLDRLVEKQGAATDLRERARLQYQRGAYDKALDDCDRLLKQLPNDPPALRLRAETLLEMGRAREALSAFDRYLTRGKADADVYRRRARARADTGDFSGVIADYTAALNLRRDGPLLAARGRAYLVNGAAKLALTDFESALELTPGDVEALIGRAEARLQVGETKLALLDVASVRKEKNAPRRVRLNTARVLALAAEKAVGMQANELRVQALDALRETIDNTPSGERAGFWREQVKTEIAFMAMRRLPGYVRLETTVMK